MEEPKEVIFFIRAYNDLDIQLPLICEFTRDPRFHVRVLSYPSDGFITDPCRHEAAGYVSRNFNVTFGSVLDHPKAPLWMRIAYKLREKAYRGRSSATAEKIPPIYFLMKALDVGMGALLRPALLRMNAAWLKDVSSGWSPAIVITDEVLFQKGRSDLIDNIIPELARKGSSLYAILTGHRVYTDVNPAGNEASSNYAPSLAARYFVPSEHNREIYKVLFPKENITVAGNLRMDSDWVKLIHDKILPNPAPLPDKPVKICMMLSKMNYGVEADRIKETIRRLGRMPGVALAIKPHTRGMRFDFMKKEEVGDAVIADKIPSASLVEWADVVLMTGSSIVFHAMLRNKIAGFLKYCQKLETIFDDGKSCVNFDSLDRLISYVERAAKSGDFLQGTVKKNDIEKFIRHEVHGDVPGGLVAQNYKNVIMADLGLDRADIKKRQSL